MSKSKPAKTENQTRIMVFGAFDFLHPGHISFFKQARKLAKHPVLIVSVARSRNVKEIKRRKPHYTEKQRVQFLKNCSLADKVILGGLRAHMPHILRERPQIIALGHDQTHYTKNLAKDLAKAGLQVRIARLKAYRRKVYKSSVYKARLRLP